MGQRPKREVVLFLVEGKSDRLALSQSIEALYDEIDEKMEVFFPIIREEKWERGGDITSRFGVNPGNIEDKIYELFLRDFFDEEKIMPKDVAQIVQIVDTDGVYIPDDRVLLVQSVPTGPEASTYYGSDQILTLNDSRIRTRNAQKRQILDTLSKKRSIKVKQKTVPYEIYYFSCNPPRSAAGPRTSPTAISATRMDSCAACPSSRSRARITTAPGHT